MLNKTYSLNHVVYLVGLRIIHFNITLYYPQGLYTPFSMLATSPTHLVALDLITQIIFGKKYTLTWKLLFRMWKIKRKVVFDVDRMNVVRLIPKVKANVDGYIVT